MIHKIKAMYDEGRGSSIREIARTLQISRNTVRKYLALDEASIDAKLSDRNRHKTLDEHRAYIIHLLETFPRLSAVKVKRKLEEKVGPLKASSRSLRRYISALREEVVQAQPRHYEPVLDHVPGVQCQVDPGELREVLIGGVATVVYFVVFVLSFSRLMFVGASRRPIDTETFIRLHDAAFRYFGGCPEECVYDQTRLVVLDEQYRELELNQRFAQYATGAGFRIRACEGYDPESKGKVEAGVKYVKHDGLYGEQFEDWAAMEQHLQRWLEEVANARVHGTTGQVPRAHFDAEERAKMRPYLTPACLAPTGVPGEPRKVDKTGLISFQSNKYSVPMAYQSGRVNVLAAPDGQLHIYAVPGGERIASHPLSQGKGVIVKNGDHYRDKARQVADLEAEIGQALGEALGRRLCRQVRRTEPQHYKDKLRGVKRHLSRLRALPEAELALLADKDGLKVSTLLEYLGAWEANPERFAQRANPGVATPASPQADAHLSVYSALTRQDPEEVAHGLH
ncbi:MAG: IS21 family transposase [Chromatiaceae bacterium]|nr:IS21 family transposase [Chromatiaceae bacterium]